MDARPSLPVFESNVVSIVCISDTHNDDPTSHIPSGDIFIHAGDMTDFGTLDELRTAYNWISALPHRIKLVVAGNHDFGLDQKHKDYKPEAVELFTNENAKAAGVQYFDRQTKVVARFPGEDGTLRDLNVYGNPCQPEFIGKPYAFIYEPDPSKDAEDAWREAPGTLDDSQIWIMHSPPLNRLDDINDMYKRMGLRGCGVQAGKLATARPLLAVFGHYHFSWGIEKVEWTQDGQQDGIKSAEILAMSPERREARGLSAPSDQSEWNFTEIEGNPRSQEVKSSLFVNAAWKTMDKVGSARNKPFKITLKLPN